MLSLARLDQLSGHVVGDCPGIEFQCLDAEAVSGDGIGIRWPSYSDAMYSRLDRLDFFRLG